MNENDEYKIAYKQVLEIIKYLPVTYYEKIPKKMIDMFKVNQESNYNFEFNPTKSFKEQGVNDKAIEILSIINEKYINNSISIMEILYRLRQYIINIFQN